MGPVGAAPGLTNVARHLSCLRWKELTWTPDWLVTSFWSPLVGPLRSPPVPCGVVRSPVVPVRSRAVPCGPLRSRAVPCGLLRSPEVPCGPLRSPAVPFVRSTAFGPCVWSPAFGPLRSVSCGRSTAFGSPRSGPSGRSPAVGLLRSVPCGRSPAIGPPAIGPLRSVFLGPRSPSVPFGPLKNVKKLIQ